jgi:uncharacterized protein YlxW (UPF0749 family)
MAEITKWEYRVVGVGSFWSTPKDEDLESVMNELGEEGWEAFSIYTQHGTSKVWISAKRPMGSASHRPRSWPG